MFKQYKELVRFSGIKPCTSTVLYATLSKLPICVKRISHGGHRPDTFHIYTIEYSYLYKKVYKNLTLNI